MRDLGCLSAEKETSTVPVGCALSVCSCSRSRFGCWRLVRAALPYSSSPTLLTNVVGFPSRALKTAKFAGAPPSLGPRGKRSHNSSPIPTIRGALVSSGVLERMEFRVCPFPHDVLVERYANSGGAPHLQKALVIERNRLGQRGVGIIDVVGKFKQHEVWRRGSDVSSRHRTQRGRYAVRRYG